MTTAAVTVTLVGLVLGLCAVALVAAIFYFVRRR